MSTTLGRGCGTVHLALRHSADVAERVPLLRGGEALLSDRFLGIGPPGWSAEHRSPTCCR
ncbi:MAG: hypothetical protein HYV63_21270 [Candidatus Schekmanbacteria bacterium]|nr:hypothetical protein [Candidatus Schekmanbacteria bacterium]